MRKRFVFICALFALANTPTIAQEPAFRYQEDAATWYRCFIRNGCVMVELKLNDSTAQEKMLRNGAELWFDTRGRKNKKTGIVFPLASSVEKPPSQKAPAPFPVATQLASSATEMKLSGFSESINGIQNQHHPSGIVVNVRFLNDTLMYSAQLPLNILAPDGDLTSKLAVGIVIKGTSERFTSMPPEGPMDAAPPPGPAPGERPEQFRMLEDDEFWCKLVVFKEDDRGSTHVIANRNKNK
jgi:hypothetical protein